jgi:ABC-type uncharacterized transport system YnjBCD substrate-binding protein
MFKDPKNLILLLAAMVVSQFATAQDTSINGEFMHGYFYGFIEATIKPVYKKEVCPKDPVPAAIKKFIAYAKANPQKLSLEPPLKHDEVLLAMKTLYPCPANPGPSPH